MTESNFHIQAEWPRAPEVGAQDIARLSIRVGDAILTRLAEVETGTNRQYLRASAVSLAFWFGDNWWRLRWEPLHDSKRPSIDWRLRHELTSASGGTNWPPIMVYGTGERVVIAPSYGRRDFSGPIRYLDLDAVHTVPGSAYEAGLDAFFDVVLDACAGAKDSTALTTLLSQLKSEREDSELAAWRQMEARLGYDPDAAPEDLIESLFALEDRLGEAAVEEAAVSAPGAGAKAHLEAAIGASEASEALIDLTFLKSLKIKNFKSRPSPWQLGEDVALEVRKLIEVPRGPLESQKFGELLGVSWFKLDSARPTARMLPYGARLRTGGTAYKLALQRKRGVDRRFEVARVVGDAIWASGGAFGVISRAKTERQKFQRAFAQSLLCPFSEIRERIDLTDPTDQQIDRAAKDYQVNAGVVRTLLLNKNILPRETLSDRLEAA